MQELLDWLEYIEDDRQQRKVRHTLKDILVIVLFATLANADDWVEIALFAESYQDYLRKYIELKNGIPSHDTIRRVMGMLSPEIIQQLYGKWQERLDKNDGELLKKIICIDGKTMCSNKRGEEKASHIVSAWSKEDGFCLGQKAVKEKSNEITAIPELLEKIQIKGQIITIDAMGTQTAIAGKIRQKRADYVLALKKNQYTMYEDVKEYFSNEEFQKEMREKGAYKKTREKAHGQIEIREYYQTEDIRWLSQKKNWKGLRSIVMEKKRIEKAGKITYEYRYFISSLKTDINEVSRAVRGHWSIESMHWHLDVTFREDANTTIDASVVFFSKSEKMYSYWAKTLSSGTVMEIHSAPSGSNFSTISRCRKPPEKTFPFRMCRSTSGGKKGSRLSSMPMMIKFRIIAYLFTHPVPALTVPHHCSTKRRLLMLQQGCFRLCVLLQLF